MTAKLYPGIAFSPVAELTDNVGAGDTIIPVSNVEAFPPAPNLATIGTDEAGETILYAAKTATALSGCTRGVEGTARAWSAGEPIARNWTAKDHGDLITAVEGAAEAAQNAHTAAQEAKEESDPAGTAETMVSAHNSDSTAHGELFAAKQPKLTGQPGQVVGFDGMGLAYAVPGWSNPDLLDNWYFVDPVNQRGQTEYTSKRIQQYTIDRWISSGDNTPDWGLYLVSGGIKLLKGSAFQQKQESPPADGTVLTFSAMIDGNVYSITFSWDSSSGYHTIPQSNGFNLGWNGVIGYVQIYNANGTGSEIVQAAKLELGSVQTLAHQNEDGEWEIIDPPPNKALELAKCQRYFYYQVGNKCSGYCSGDRAYMFIPLPSKIRVTPSVSISYSNNIVDADGGVYAVTDVLDVQSNACGVSLTLRTERPSNSGMSIFSNADTQFILDANL